MEARPHPRLSIYLRPLVSIAAVSAWLAPFVGLLNAQDSNSAPPRSISGRVVDSTGTPIPHAYIWNGAKKVSTVADAQGRFRVVALPGTSEFVISARKLGYSPVDTTLSDPKENAIAITMRAIPQGLNTVVITGNSGYNEYLDRTGFYRRLATRVDGTFLSREQIERRNATEISAVLRDVSGVRIISQGGRAGKNNFVLGRGGLCALGLVVDGQRVEVRSPPLESIQPRITSIMGGRPAPATHSRSGRADLATLDEVVNPSTVAAIEIYPSAAAVPSSLQHHADGCGLIVAWTRYDQK